MRRRVVMRNTDTEPDRSERALQAAVDSLRAALGARIVYAFSLARDGELHCVGVSPAEHARTANIAPREHPESVSLLCKGVAGILESWSEPQCPGCVGVFVPWWSEEGPVGAALAVMDEVPDATALRLASAHGASVGSRITAERVFAAELRRLGMLEQLNGLLEAAFASTTDAIVQVDLDGVVLRWNDAAERLYGWTASQVTGRPIVDLGEGWTQFARGYLLATAANAEASERDVVQTDRSGNRFQVRMTLLPMLDESGNPGSVVAIARTVPHPREVPVADAGAGDLAAVMVRELTGPLTAIIGYAELLSRSAIVEDSEQRSRVTHGLRHCCEDLARLLEDLMFLSRLDASALHLEPVDVAELCRALVSRYAGETRGAGFGALEVRGEGLARVDRRSAEASVQGLLRCLARHCSPDAEVGLTVSSTATVTSVRIDVREPDEAASADLTGRLRASAEDDVTEHGLGLAVARLVAEAHGGALTLGSGAASDTTLTLELPALVALDPAEEERWNSTMV